MRITGGTHRSRKLETPKNNAIRPTSDKVRQAIFNMLNARGLVNDAVVIDAFCGTGALGLEAISQGAKFCSFFDKSKESSATCKNNIQILNEEDKTKFILTSALKVKEKPDDILPATLLFLDPPYKKDLMTTAINSLHQSNWLNEACFILAEMDKSEDLIMNEIEIINQKIYGDTKIILARLK